MVEKGSVLFLFLRQTGHQFQALFRTGVNTAAAEDAAELLKTPLLGGTGDFDGVGRAFAGTHAAEDALLIFNDQFAPLPGEGLPFDRRVVAGHGTFDEIAENIFEYGK